jgi:hypothetical protein
VILLTLFALNVWYDYHHPLGIMFDVVLAVGLLIWYLNKYCDACGTAAPGGSEFIRALNSHGVHSLISTSTAIPGPMGGQFLKIFMELLAEHPDYTVSRARYEAVKALRNGMGATTSPTVPKHWCSRWWVMEAFTCACHNDEQVSKVN